MIKTALTIAGSDSSGGAGVQADIKTFSALRVYGTSAITAVTAQNTQRVAAASAISPQLIKQQIISVINDIPINAYKIGMLANRDIVLAVTQIIKKHQLQPIVLDPVMVAQSGDSLLDDSAINALRNELLPLASIVTPNLHEAAALLDVKPHIISAKPANYARKIVKELGAAAVLIKGGHLDEEQAKDYFYDGREEKVFSATRIKTENIHGSGCTLAAAICAYLARNYPLVDAIYQAKQYISKALAQADQMNIGKGSGPVAHFHAWW